MNILLIPTVREIYKNQLELSVDHKLINFFESTFKNCKIRIFTKKIIQFQNLIVFCGGNSLSKKKAADVLRNKINSEVYKFAIRHKIKMLGICYGAQFLAKENKFKFANSKNHVGAHDLKLNFKKKSLKIKVNSYHKTVICKKSDKQINSFGYSFDGYVEAFHIKNKKILGLMWHPERYSKIKKIDQKIIKTFYANNSFSSW
tara:strand:- start:466 stop:1071 length:606 start_codon:yes stop_codon:yes gene_type:complete